MCDFFEDQRVLIKAVNAGYGDKEEIKRNMNEVYAKSKYFCFRIIGREIQTWGGRDDLATTIYKNFESDRGIAGVIMGGADLDSKYAQTAWIPREELLKRLRAAKKREHHVFHYVTELNI